MKQTLKQKKLTKQIKNNSFCKVTPQDIYDNTDFFKQTKQPYKLAFILSVIVVFISITMISVLGYQNYKLLTKGPEIVYVDNIKYKIDDTKGMTEEEKQNLRSELDYFNINSICSIDLTNNIIMYLYYGYNENYQGKKTYFYYYAFSNLFSYSQSIYINVNDYKIEISEVNRIGLLTTIDGGNTNNFTLEFTISVGEKEVKYVLKDSNY